VKGWGESVSELVTGRRRWGRKNERKKEEKKKKEKKERGKGDGDWGGGGGGEGESLWKRFIGVISDEK
jgi:hypothetical protein